MQVKQLPSITLTGLKVRTCNADEMNSGTAKITELWQKFGDKHGQQLTKNTKTYGVYTNYESDVTGEFDVIACCDDLSIGDQKSVKVTTEAGSYLVFNGTGEMPDAVIDLWGEIWQYFSSDDCRFIRTYSSDYEYYKSADEVEIAIAVKE
ncbi:GyrI-like domain-containing protein [Pseudoalteromonas sp. JB197]|uniref:GyrI-like domain-containing protein n=1 Tax=Pseudoalteromonas sp. JB197 TaxID=1434839 RepID=UPI00097E7A8F|nr:GyrI-like domain-containing protein [Pseudoalteromonas sp. JB197]PCC10379.1 AraC family transcriptional regulator [Pseudoalteromonas sp. JB197]SJN40728.1 Probable transcription regulator [Pseudoalteromonas sp. JB197]